jgi:hypothetical protein
MVNKIISRDALLGKESPLVLFVIVPVVLNAVLIGLYFSGVHWMQQIVAPTIEGLKYSQWREFGLMEMIQNALLLSVILLFIHALFTKEGFLNKLFYATGAAVFVFLFLEEIDYGLHYYEYLSGELLDTELQRNWHNQWDEDGIEYATHLKRLNDLVNLLWFVLVPCLVLIPQVKRVLARVLILPSSWFIATAVITVLFSQLAHYLDDNGYAIIDGRNGNLYRTIAEFRETSLYYMYFIYARQLVQLKRLIK